MLAQAAWRATEHALGQLTCLVAGGSSNLYKLVLKLCLSVGSQAGSSSVTLQCTAQCPSRLHGHMLRCRRTSKYLIEALSFNQSVCGLPTCTVADRTEACVLRRSPQTGAASPRMGWNAQALSPGKPPGCECGYSQDGSAFRRVDCPCQHVSGGTRSPILWSLSVRKFYQAATLSP